LKEKENEKKTLEKELEEKCNVIDGKYYIAQTGDRKWYGLRTMTKIQLDPLTTMYNVQAIKDEVIEKARVKLIQLEKLDIKSIKSFITYLNKELPDMKIIQDIIPLTARLIKDTMECEVKLKTMVSSKLVKMINDIKDDKFKLTLQKEGILSKIYRYLRNVFTFTEEKEFDMNVTQLDF